MTKLDKLRIALNESDIPALIVTDELNIRYLTGFDVQDAFMLVTVKEAYLLTDFRYYEVALKTLEGICKIETPSSKLSFIKDIITKEGYSKLGFEGNTLSYGNYVSFSEYFEGISLINIGDMLNTLRMIKTDDEIEKIQKSQDITDRAFSELLKVIKPDMTEIDVAAELEYLMKKMGSEGPAFSTIAVSGDASALPHGVPRNVKLKKGFLTLDFGSKFEGYCSDMTRTIVIGKADKDMIKLYNTVLSAQNAALEYLIDGRDQGEADAVARRIIDIDYKGAFGHSLGHGVGLLVHEQPALTPKNVGKVLLPGNIVTVEPGIYLFGKYGCRIEDMVAIKENGIHNFTHSTKEIIEIM